MCEIIAFPRGVSPRQSARMASLDAIDCIGLDTSADIAACQAEVPRNKAVQGNLDPLLLLAGGPSLEKDVGRIVKTFAGRPHVFNLGHGILPPTPIAHVERLMRNWTVSEPSRSADTAPICSRLPPC